MVDAVPRLGVSESDAALALSGLPQVMREFLAAHAIEQRLIEIRRNTTSAATFRTRFYRWFNAFRCRKFVHHAVQRRYGQVPVHEAAAYLLHRRGIAFAASREPCELLRVYRRLDRTGNCAASEPRREISQDLGPGVD